MMREKDLILNVSTPYPRPRVTKRQAAGQEIQYELTNLPPYAEITVQVCMSQASLMVELTGHCSSRLKWQF